MRGVEQKKKRNRLCLGGSATAVSAFKVSAKNGLFLGQMTADAARGSHLSGAWREHSKRPKNKPFFAVKNFSSERHFLDTLFCC
jgi:hypothetical protein